MSVLLESNWVAGRFREYSSKNVSGSVENDVETLEEYKCRIRQEIDKISFHPSHKKITETLVISEEGYQAMKDDPEYEKWVLGYIRENRSVNMSIMTSKKEYISGTDYEYIGATKEECRGEGYNEWDYSEDFSGSSTKKNKKSDISGDSTDYMEFWEQMWYKRAYAREERNKEYFAHKSELEQMNRKLADKCYKDNFVFQNG